MSVSRFSSTAALAALFTPTVLFISAGNGVILGNLQDIPYDAHLVGGFLAGALLCTCALFPAFVRADGNRRWAEIVRGALALGLCVLLFRAVSRFTARPGVPSGLIIAADVLVVMGVAAALSVSRVAYLLRVCAVIAVALLAEGLLRHGWMLAHQQRARVELSHQRSPGGGATADEPPGNVYHFVVDGFQSATYAQVVAANPELRPDQFTVYPGFTSHYGHTAMSVPNALLGRLYSPEESAAAWMREGFTGGLWAELERTGVGVALYPFFAEHCPPRSTHCIPAPLVAYMGRATLIDLWFLSILPRSVEVRLGRDVVPADADATLPPPRRPFSLTQAVRRLAGRDAAAASGGTLDEIPLQPGDYAANSLVGFEALLEAEARRPPRGQYVFFHAILPHRPYLLDDACVYQGEGWTTETAAYLAQAACGLRLVQRFADRLRELNRFDEALIVVHADHGLWRETRDKIRSTFLDRQELVMIGLRGKSAAFLSDPVAIARRSSALLLLKLPGQTEARESAAPALTLDIVPTVLHHVGLATDAYPGIPLQALDDAADRERVFFSNPFGRGWNMEGPLRKFVMVDGRWEFREELPLRE